jgi:NADH-quinone oxidoreductase subunit E
MAQGNGVFPPEHLKEEFEKIVARYPKPTAALIPILMRLQEEYRHINTEHMDSLAEYLGTTPAHVLGVVTFYTMFSQKERGKHHIYLCKTLSCHIRGAVELLAAFEKKLGVKAHSGEKTEDGEFSIETAECLGLCEQAPCILVDDKR